MAQWVSFDVIKEAVKFDALLERYGLLRDATTKQTKKGTVSCGCAVHSMRTAHLHCR